MSPRNCFRFLLSVGLIGLFSTTPSEAKPAVREPASFRELVIAARSLVLSLLSAEARSERDAVKTSVTVDPGGAPLPSGATGATADPPLIAGPDDPGQ